MEKVDIQTNLTVREAPYRKMNRVLLDDNTFTVLNGNEDDFIEIPWVGNAHYWSANLFNTSPSKIKIYKDIAQADVNIFIGVVGNQMILSADNGANANSFEILTIIEP